MKNVVQPARPYNGVFPVGIVQLDLDEFDLGMGVKRLFKVFRTAVEGETEMPDLPLRLLLQCPVIAPEPFIGIAVVSVLYGMQQIKIEIFQTAALQLLRKNAVPVRFLLQLPCRQLGGDHEAVSGIALCQRLFDSLFGMTVMVNIGGVKVIHPGIKIGVCHTADLVDVDFPVLLRQAHQAKTELGHGT